MRRGWTASVLAIAAAIAFISPASAGTYPHKQAHVASRAYNHAGMRLGFAPHVPHYAALVGDRHSGLGFYPLPERYRVGAARYRFFHQPPPWANPVRQAAAADSLRSYYSWIPRDPGYRHGVYDYYDGVGTPYFAGYYSAGDDDDDEDYHPLFGRHDDD